MGAADTKYTALRRVSNRTHSSLDSKLQQERPKGAPHRVSLEEEQIGVPQGKPCLRAILLPL